MWFCCPLSSFSGTQKSSAVLGFGVALRKREKKKKARRHQHYLEIKSKCSVFFSEEYLVRRLPCARLWGGKTKTASSVAPCWEQIKITVRRQEQLLRETGWHTEWWGSVSHTSWHSISLKLLQLYSLWLCVCVWVWELRFTFATGGALPGERAQTSPIQPITAGPVGTLARQGAVGAKTVSGTVWGRKSDDGVDVRERFTKGRSCCVVFRISAN